MTRTGAQTVQKAAVAGFKYYIHDTASGFVLEMSGPLNQPLVTELNSCWQTAKTTLRNRKLTLDLRRLTSMDDGAKVWLASMAQDGAEFLPKSFLLDAEAGMPRSFAAEPVRRTLAARLSTAIRGCRKTVTQEL